MEKALVHTSESISSTIKVKFSDGEYRGYITFNNIWTMGIHGFGILETLKEYLLEEWTNEDMQKQILEKEGCELTLLDDDCNMWFRLIMNNEDGTDTMEHEDSLEELSDFIVSMEIIESVIR